MSEKKKKKKRQDKNRRYLNKEIIMRTNFNHKKKILFIIKAFSFCFFVLLH